MPQKIMRYVLPATLMKPYCNCGMLIIVARPLSPNPDIPSKGKSLLDLPPELRNYIYDLTLPSHPVITSKARPRRWKTAPALLAVCSQIRSEALSMYYNSREFRFTSSQLEIVPLWVMRHLIDVQGEVALRFQIERDESHQTEIQVHGSDFTERIVAKPASDEERKLMKWILHLMKSYSDFEWSQKYDVRFNYEFFVLFDGDEIEMNPGRRVAQRSGDSRTDLQRLMERSLV